MSKKDYEHSLLTAAEDGDLQAMQDIILVAADFVDLNCKDGFGNTPLILAAERPDNTAMIKLLLDSGAAINATNDLRRSALIEAASIGDMPNVALLLQYNPDSGVVTSEQETALTFAVVNEYAAVVKALLGVGADVNWRDPNGWMPLTYAVYSRNPEIVRILIEVGADPHATDVNGDTILIHAVRSGSIEVVREILKEKPEVDHVGNEGLTALQHAERNGFEEIGQLLRESAGP